MLFISFLNIFSQKIFINLYTLWNYYELWFLVIILEVYWTFLFLNQHLSLRCFVPYMCNSKTDSFLPCMGIFIRKWYDADIMLNSTTKFCSKIPSMRSLYPFKQVFETLINDLYSVGLYIILVHIYSYCRMTRNIFK